MKEYVGTDRASTSRFTRSVNVQQDLWQEESLRGYHITAGTRRALLRIAPARYTPEAVRAWTLTGPYGTGKSSFANFAAKLLGGDFVPGHSAACRLLRSSDSDLAQQVHPPRKSMPALLPIVITGSREPLQLAVLRGLHVALGHLRGRRCSRVMARIAETLAHAVAGKQPSAQAVTDLFSDALKGACATEEVGGFFLVLDELGKLLEYAAAQPAISDLYTLQALAEFAVRTRWPFLILGILHQDYSLYADRLSGRERAEWEKVRGRFEDIAFEEPVDELLRLIAEARSQCPDGTNFNQLPAPTQRRFRKLCEQAWLLQLAPQRMTKREFLNLLMGCFPLHPLTTLVLGPLFRKLAQNERSVFSFLESSEPHGLRDHLERAGSRLYFLHDLYDYLLGSIGEALYLQMQGKRWAEVETVLARLPQAGVVDVALVKTIGLLGAMGQWRNLLATKEILRFMLPDTSSSELHSALRGLRSKQAIVYRSYNHSFGLWEGSDIDLDEHIRAARGRIDPTKGTAALAAQFIVPRPLVAKRHSFTTGSLRYFEVSFVGLAEFRSAVQEPRRGGDGQVLIVLPDASAAGEPAENQARDVSLRDRPDLLVVVPTETRSLEDILHELASLEWIRTNTPELEGDATARRELRARIATQRRNLNELLLPILAPGGGGAPASTWFHRGQKHRITSRRGLQDFLSRLCDETYKSTPNIHNELINRRELSSAAAAARRNLIEAMLQHGDQPDLGLEGTPPEKSMYLSVLRQTGIHRKSGDCWQFCAPSRTADEGIRKVWGAITGFFAQSEHNAGPISTLYERLAAPPFGVLAGPMPVLLCAALLANDARVALYEEGSFVPQLNIAAFERLLRAPERFAVQQWRLSGVRTTVFHRLAELLEVNIDDATPDKTDVLMVVRPLFRFMARLTDYAKRTQRISPVAQSIRQHLTTATRPDTLVFESLPTACGVQPITPRTHLSDEDLLSFVTALREALTELHHCYDELLVELTRSISQAFGIDGTRSQLRQRLAERSAGIKEWVADPALKSFIIRASDPGLDDLLWLESIVALLAQKPPSGWRDDDRAKFEVALMNTARLFAHVERLAFAQPSTTTHHSDDDAIRIGITTRTAPEVEHVIHVPGRDREEVVRLQDVVTEALTQAGVNGHAYLAAAALARVINDLLAARH